jgi:hypothetical protein
MGPDRVEPLNGPQSSIAVADLQSSGVAKNRFQEIPRYIYDPIIKDRLAWYAME